jgi:hypothetical protein
VTIGPGHGAAGRERVQSVEQILRDHRRRDRAADIQLIDEHDDADPLRRHQVDLRQSAILRHHGNPWVEDAWQER